MNPANLRMPSFLRRGGRAGGRSFEERPSGEIIKLRSGQSLDVCPIRGDFCELGIRHHICVKLFSINWILAFAGMVGLQSRDN